MAEFVKTMLEDTDTLIIKLREFSDLMYDLAYDDSIEVFRYLAERLKNNTSVRDLISQESDIKIFYMAYFSLIRLYASISEIELNQGYADILLLKAPNIKDNIPNILIEFKFHKQSEKEIDINKSIKEAKTQLQKYKQTTKFKIDKSIIVIFKGFELIYCEWGEKENLNKEEK